MILQIYEKNITILQENIKCNKNVIKMTPNWYGFIFKKNIKLCR